MKKILIGILIGVVGGGIIVFMYNQFSQQPKETQLVLKEDTTLKSLPKNEEIPSHPESPSENTPEDSSASVETLPQTTDHQPQTSFTRFWSITSTDYTLSQTSLGDFWKNAPGEVYAVCMKDDLERCTRLVQYEGTIQDYVLEHYKYMFRDGSYTPSAEELEEFQRFAPAVTREFDTNYMHWKFGTWGNEFVGGAFTETPKGLIVIYEDSGSGMGFGGQDVQVLAGKIEVK